MHPFLDKPHPDCQDVIRELKACQLSFFRKVTGQCTDAHVRLNQCFKEEKAKKLKDIDKDFIESLALSESTKTMSFAEYLAQDKEYQAAKAKAAKK